MVTSLITTYDGGKAIAGFSRKSSTLYSAWIVKMFGTVGTKACASANTAITGYVNMLMIINNGLTPANCNASSNA